MQSVAAVAAWRYLFILTPKWSQNKLSWQTSCEGAGVYWAATPSTRTLETAGAAQQRIVSFFHFDDFAFFIKKELKIVIESLLQNRDTFHINSFNTFKIDWLCVVNGLDE